MGGSLKLSIKEESELLHKIVKNVGQVIIGKEKIVELVVLSLISGGHVLLEDIPGVGKTSLISALSKSIVCEFKRIQFTPDILPSDITGFSMYNQKTGNFEFRKGAAMSNFVLADEINRASAKSQASLLEVMEEKQVTVDSKTYKLEEPFMVLATQNPVENLGTYPLPEAQLDRFHIKTSIGYPGYNEEIKIITMGKDSRKKIDSVATGEDIIRIKDKVKDIRVEGSVAEYIVTLVRATREHEDLKLGASPRGSIALYEMSQSYALYQGRDYVIPDDVKYLAPFVLPHRFILTHKAKISKKTPEEILDEIILSVNI